MKAAADYAKVSVDRIIVVQDELDIPFGTIRLKAGGGDGGHNGIRSIKKSMGSGDFTRVRVGIDRPPGRQDPADYVLRSLVLSNAGVTVGCIGCRRRRGSSHH